VDRTERSIADRYHKGMMAFITEGLAPPPSVVKSGELPVDEAVSHLMTLHEDCVAYVSQRVPRFEERVERLGPTAVEELLIEKLADHYGLPVDEIHQGFAVRGDPQAAYDRRVQPRDATGRLDVPALAAESGAELARHGWAASTSTVDGFATPYDPRLALVRSRIAVRPDGVAWVSVFRPQNFQVAYFEALRTIHRQSGQWCLDFGDWRRRRIAPSEEDPAWTGFVDQIRRLSTQAGFTWRTPTQGLRSPVFDAVIYNVADWTEERRASLARSLLAASIPHQWDGSDLQVSTKDEQRVDRIIDRL
jgi:hypothetical protein